MQTNDLASVVISSPTTEAEWLNFAINCVAMANSQGGIITLDDITPVLDNKSLNLTIETKLNCLTKGLVFLLFSTTDKQKNDIIQIQILPTTCSLNDGRFFICQHHKITLVTAENIQTITHALSREICLKIVNTYANCFSILLSYQGKLSALNAIVNELESIIASSRIIISQLEKNNRLKLLAAPSMPSGVQTAINGITIGAKSATCATALWRQEIVTCPNIEQDPLWHDFSHIALSYGLKSCFSVPVISNEKQPLGVISVYFSTKGDLNDNDIFIVKTFTLLIAKVIEFDDKNEQSFGVLQGLENSLQPIVIFDSQGRIEQVNNAFCQLIGKNKEQLLYLPLSSVIANENSNEQYQAFWTQITHNRQWQGRLFFNNSNEQPTLAEFTVSAIIDNNNQNTHYFCLVRDLTQQQSSIDELTKLAFFDVITGLPNRSLLKDRLGMAIANQRRNCTYGALLFIDLDHFKRVNDLHGHNHGDLVLSSVAKRLSKLLREEDTLARIGGDEFVALLIGFGSHYSSAKKQAIAIANKMRKSLSLPFTVNQHKHYLGASIGVSLFPKGIENADDLLREADAAMYDAKIHGRNLVKLFEPAMQSVIHQRSQLERALKDACLKNQFRLFFQAQVDENNKICSAEALIRWQHPTDGLLTPITFLSCAEETGHIIDINTWLINEVCQFIAICSNYQKILPISINISERQFNEPEFIIAIEDIIRTTQVNPALLTFELPEHLLMGDILKISKVMHTLAFKGIKFAINDFGIGFTNLNYLNQLPFNEIKINKTFVDNVAFSDNDIVVIEAIKNLAQQLNMILTAVGIENNTQERIFSELKCNKKQGFLYSKPLPADEFLDLWLDVNKF